MESSSHDGQLQNKKPRSTRHISKEHVFRKRQPHKLQRGDNVLYVSSKTNTKALVDRCNKLIIKGENKLTIYCLGAAIQRGILLALNICEHNVTFQIHTNTFTTELLDDLEPITDDANYCTQARSNSALKINIYRVDPLEAK